MGEPCFVCSAAESVHISLLHIHTSSPSVPVVASHCTRVIFVINLGNGLSSPHSADKNGPGDRQSTMPPSVPIRKEKKDVPVRTSKMC